MPKSNRGGRRATPAPTPAPTTNNTGIGNLSFTAWTDQEASDLRDEMDSLYSASVVDAIKQYISKATDASGYSMAQNLNYKLENDLPLNANEKFMLKYIQKGMHDIGKDTVLYRGCHEDVLQKLGIQNYQQYTGSQLKQMLTGAEFANKSFTSTSYDKSKNPFYTGVNSGGREVEMVIKAPATSKMVFGARSQAEVILNTNTKFRITDVRYTGRIATPRNAGSKKVIELEVEIVE